MDRHFKWADNYSKFNEDFNSNVILETAVSHFFDRLFPYPIDRQSAEFKDCLEFSKAIASIYDFPPEKVFDYFLDWAATQMY